MYTVSPRPGRGGDAVRAGADARLVGAAVREFFEDVDFLRVEVVRRRVAMAVSSHRCPGSYWTLDISLNVVIHPVPLQSPSEPKATTSRPDSPRPSERGTCVHLLGPFWSGSEYTVAPGDTATVPFFRTSVSAPWEP